MPTLRRIHQLAALAAGCNVAVSGSEMSVRRIERRTQWIWVVGAAVWMLSSMLGDAQGRRPARPAAPPPAVKSFEPTKVCEQVSGDAVATALKGQLLDVRPVNLQGLPSARCVYGIAIADARRTFVLWFNPATDYDGLRKVANASVKPVTGIGDAAHVTTDEDRFSLTATIRNKVTIQVTGEQLAWVQTVAALALSTVK